MENNKPLQTKTFSPATAFIYYKIFIEPTISPSPATQKASEKSKWLPELLTQTNGKLNLNQLEIQKLKDAGKIPQNINPQEFELALNLFTKGAQADEWLTASDKLNLNEAEKESTAKVAQHLLTLSDAEEELNKKLYFANQEPRVEIVQATSTTPLLPPPQQVNQINMSFHDKTTTMVFQTGIEKAKGLVFDKAQAKLNNFVTGALEKSGNKVLQQIGSKGLKTFAKSTFTKVAAKVAAKLGAKAIAAAIGTTVGGPLGTAIGYAAGWLLEKAGKLLKPIFNGIKKLLSFITGEKDFRKQLAYLGLTGMVIGLGLGSMPLIAISGAVGLGSLALITSGAVVATGIFASVSAALAAFFSITIGAFLAPLLIALVVIPVSIALILFIINSSAFVVPYGGYDIPIAGGESAYIRVEKEANPSGNLPNSRRTITYTITITALRASLTNLRFEETCRVIPQRDCTNNPPVQNIQAGVGATLQAYNSFDEIEQSIGQISPANPLTITYTREFNGGTFDYADSRVTDRFTVSADVEGNQSTSSGSASICFGNCPTGCYEVVNEESWPANYLATFNDAAGELVSSHPLYIDKVCSDGNTIPVCYDPIRVGYWGCHGHFGRPGVCNFSIDHTQCDITLYSGGLDGATSDAVYILAHESAHHLDRISGYYSDFNSYPGRVISLCSYSATSSCPGGHCGESFAETIALYSELPSFWSSPGRCPAGSTYQGLYPANYEFARDIIYEE